MWGDGISVKPCPSGKIRDNKLRCSYRPFRYKLIQLSCFSRTWPKGRGISPQIFFWPTCKLYLKCENVVQFHCLSSYQNDFVWKQPVSKAPHSTKACFRPSRIRFIATRSFAKATQSLFSPSS